MKISMNRDALIHLLKVSLNQCDNDFIAKIATEVLVKDSGNCVKSVVYNNNTFDVESDEELRNSHKKL